MGGTIKRQAWLNRKQRVRKKAKGTSERPRLSVFRSGRHIYAQLIDDLAGRTIVAASSREKSFGGTDSESGRGSNRAGAAEVGKTLGERAKAKGVEQIVFDRNGYLYHGRIKALADGVRETGVKF